MTTKTTAQTGTRHDEELARLARIEGQVRGVRRMVEEGAYCIDILNQVQAARAALRSVSQRVLRRHLERCVTETLAGGRRGEAGARIQEVLDVLERMEQR